MSEAWLLVLGAGLSIIGALIGAGVSERFERKRRAEDRLDNRVRDVFADARGTAEAVLVELRTLRGAIGYSDGYLFGARNEKSAEGLRALGAIEDQSLVLPLELRAHLDVMVFGLRSADSMEQHGLGPSVSKRTMAVQLIDASREAVGEYLRRDKVSPLSPVQASVRDSRSDLEEIYEEEWKSFEQSETGER
jgi:hypothetical protein